jgi:hypothetical protein
LVRRYQKARASSCILKRYAERYIKEANMFYVVGMAAGAKNSLEKTVEN